MNAGTLAGTTQMALPEGPRRRSRPDPQSIKLSFIPGDKSSKGYGLWPARDNKSPRGQVHQGAQAPKGLKHQGTGVSVLGTGVSVLSPNLKGLKHQGTGASVLSP